MKRLLLLFTLISAVYHLNAQDEFGVRDSILDAQTHRHYLTGIRLFPQETDSATINKIFDDNDIYYCMKYIDKILVVANISIEDFSLGGPYERLKESAIYARFENSPMVARLSPDTEEDECSDGDCNCGPKAFVVFMKNNDAISYSRVHRDSDLFDFSSALLHSSLFRFGEYYVGKDIRDCKIGKLIPISILDKYPIIQIDPYEWYNLWGIEQKDRWSNSASIELYLKDRRIQEIEISHGYYGI